MNAYAQKKTAAKTTLNATVKRAMSWDRSPKRTRSEGSGACVTGVRVRSDSGCMGSLPREYAPDSASGVDRFPCKLLQASRVPLTTMSRSTLPASLVLVSSFALLGACAPAPVEVAQVQAPAASASEAPEP